MRLARLVLLVSAFAVAAIPVKATPILFEHLPETNSSHVSHHTAGGPVIADDFDPAASGGVGYAEWWGSSAPSTDWELTLHFGTLSAAGSGQPAAIPVATGGRKYFVNSAGQDPDGDGIYYFASVLPGDFFVMHGPVPFGTEYWFSIANFAPGWTWAFAGAGPTVGDEHWSAVVSQGALCGDGGPHCGPWNQIQGRDFAFRLDSVPEPATLLLLGTGLLGARIFRRRT